MTTRPFGVAIVGTGIMGRRMMAAMRAHDRFRVAVLWDPDAAALRSVVGDVPGARAARSLDDCVHDRSVDLVYIASPPATHRACVAAALAAGRGCLCEKPLAPDVDDAEALRDLVVDARLPFAIHFPFASAPASRGLADLLREGRLGPVRSAAITARFAAWPRPWQVGASAWLSGAVEGGFTREVLSHFVFLAQRLFGAATVADVRLTRDDGRAETALTARLVHADTTVVTIDAAVAGDVADHNRFEIVGTAGAAALVDWSRLEIAGTTSERVDATASTLDQVAAMLDGRAHDLATVGEGVAVVRCIEALLRG